MELVIRTDWPQFANDLADVVRIFFGAVPWKTESTAGAIDEETGGKTGEASARADLLTLTHTEQREDGVVRVLVSAEGAFSGREEERYVPQDDPLSEKRLHKRAIKLASYRLLKEASGVTPPWGSLTGIRPTRLVYAEMDKGLALPAAVQRVRETFDVSAQKADLLSEIICRQVSTSCSSPVSMHFFTATVNLRRFSSSKLFGV